MFERFTDRARRVLNLAQEEARWLEHPFIGTEHILLGLIHEGEGVAAKALEALDVTLAATREAVAEAVSPHVLSTSGGSPPFTPRAKKILELSLREALQLEHSYIGTEHLLLGLLRQGDSVAVHVLVRMGTDLGALRQKVIQLMSGAPGKRATVARPSAARDSGADPVRAHRFALGRRLSAEVVVSGHRPEDVASAYDQLANLARRIGLDNLDTSRPHFSSVDTEKGPGLRLSVSRELPPEGAVEGGAGEGGPQDGGPEEGGAGEGGAGEGESRSSSGGDLPAD